MDKDSDIVEPNGDVWRLMDLEDGGQIKNWSRKTYDGPDGQVVIEKGGLVNVWQDGIAIQAKVMSIKGANVWLALSEEAETEGPWPLYYPEVDQITPVTE